MKKITKRESPDWFEAWKTNFRTIHNRAPIIRQIFQQVIRMEQKDVRVCVNNWLRNKAQFVVTA